MTLTPDARPIPRKIPAGLNPTASVALTDDAVLVRCGDHVVRLRGGRLPAFTEALVTLLDGGARVIDLGPQVDEGRMTALEAVLQQLVAAGLLGLDGDAQAMTVASGTAMGLWLRTQREVPLDVIGRRLGAGSCAVLGAGLLAERIATELRAAGVPVTAAGGPDTVPAATDATRDLVVVVGRDEQDPLLDTWNDVALRTGRSWLPVLPFDGRRATVGPWTLPGESACYTCFRMRRIAAFPDRDVSTDLAQARPVPATGDRAGLFPGLSMMQVGLVVERVAEWIGLTVTNSGLVPPGGVYTLDLTRGGLGLTLHRVLRVPRCPACSPARDRGYPMVWFHPAADDAGDVAARAESGR